MERSRRPKTCPTAMLSELAVPAVEPLPVGKRLMTAWQQHELPGGVGSRHPQAPWHGQRPHEASSHGAEDALILGCREPNDVGCVDFQGEFATSDGHTCTR